MIKQTHYKNPEIYFNPETNKYIIRVYLATLDDFGKTTLCTKDIEYSTTDDALFYLLSKQTINLFNERNKKGKPWKTYLKGNTKKKLLSLV